MGASIGNALGMEQRSTQQVPSAGEAGPGRA